MNILISNDDGVHAPGIEALFNALKDTMDKITERFWGNL